MVFDSSQREPADTTPAGEAWAYGRARQALVDAGLLGPEPAEAPGAQTSPSAVGGGRGDPSATDDASSLPDTVIILRRDGSIVFTNRAVGGVPAGQVLETSIFDYVAPQQHDAVRTCLVRVFERTEVAGCDLAGLYPGAADLWFECRFAPSRRGGEVVAATGIVRDITERRRREEALREERDALLRQVEQLVVDRAVAKLAHRESDSLAGVMRSARIGDAWRLFDDLGEAVFVTDASTGDVVDVNQIACRWLRRRREELVGRRTVELDLDFPLLAVQPPQLALTDTREAQRPVLVADGHNSRRDHSTFPVEVSVTRHAIDGRDVFVAVVRDVQRRVRATEAVHEAERLHRALFEEASEAVFLMGRDGRLLDANPAALALFGYERTTFLALNARQLYDSADDIRRFQEAVAQKGRIDGMVTALRLASGAVVRARLWAMPRGNGDGRNIRGYQCIVREFRAAVATDTERVRRVSRPTQPGRGA